MYNRILSLYRHRTNDDSVDGIFEWCFRGSAGNQPLPHQYVITLPGARAYTHPLSPHTRVRFCFAYIIVTCVIKLTNFTADHQPFRIYMIIIIISCAYFLPLISGKRYNNFNVFHNNNLISTTYIKL